MYCKLEGETQYQPYKEVESLGRLGQVTELRAVGHDSPGSAYLAPASIAIARLDWQSMTALKKISITNQYKLTDLALPHELVLEKLEEISIDGAVYDSKSMHSLLDHSPNLNYIDLIDSTRITEWDEDEDEDVDAILRQRIAEINRKKSASMPSSSAGKLTGETDVPTFEQSSERSGQSTPDQPRYRKMGSSRSLGGFEQDFSARTSAAPAASAARTANAWEESDSDSSAAASQSRSSRNRRRKSTALTAEEWQRFTAERARKMSRKTESDSGSGSGSESESESESESDASTMRGVTSASPAHLSQRGDSEGIQLHIVQKSGTRVISMNDFLQMKPHDKRQITSMIVEGNGRPLSLNLADCRELKLLKILNSKIIEFPGVRMTANPNNLTSVHLVDCELHTRGVLQLLEDGPRARLSIDRASIVSEENHGFLGSHNLILFTTAIRKRYPDVTIESITLAEEPFVYDSGEESESDLDVGRLPGSVVEAAPADMSRVREATRLDDDEQSLSTVSGRARSGSEDTAAWRRADNPRGGQRELLDISWMADFQADEPGSSAASLAGREPSADKFFYDSDREPGLAAPAPSPLNPSRMHVSHKAHNRRDSVASSGNESIASEPQIPVVPGRVSTRHGSSEEDVDHLRSYLGETDTRHSSFDGSQSGPEASSPRRGRQSASSREKIPLPTPAAYSKSYSRAAPPVAAASSSTNVDTTDYMRRSLGETDIFPNTGDRTRAKNRSVARRKQSSESIPGLSVDSNPHVLERGRDRGYSSDHSDVAAEAAPSSLRDANADNRRDNVMSSQYGVSSTPAPSLRPRNAATGYRSNTMDAGSTQRDLGGAGMRRSGVDQPPPGSQREAESPTRSHTGNSDFSFERERDREYSSVPPTAAAAASSRTHQMRENLRSHRLPDQTSHVFRGQRYKVDTEVEMDARADEPRDLSTIERSISEGLERYLPVTTERDSYALTVNQRNNIVQLSYISQDSRRHDIIPVLSASSESVKVYKSWQQQVDPGNQAIPLPKKALIILASLGIPPDFPEGGIRVSQENSKLGREVIKQYQVLKELHQPDEDIDLTVSVNRRR